MGQHLLVLEDDQHALSSITKVLNEAGYTTDTATDENKFVQHLENSQYAAILADYYIYTQEDGGERILDLRGSDAYKLARLLAGRTIPIIGGSSDIAMWQGVATKTKDPHLHCIPKLPEGFSSVWDAHTVLAKLKELGL